VRALTALGTRRRAIWLCALLVSSLAACTDGGGKSDASGVAGAGGGGAGGTSGQAGTTGGGGAGAAGQTGGAGGRGGGAGGTAGSGGTGGSGSCAGLASSTFRSVTEQECGLTPDGAAMCRWRLTFTLTTVQWQYSDVVETGTFACSGGVVSAQLGSRPITAQYDAATRTVVWEGLSYVVE
jgi:hypothetical protein